MKISSDLKWNFCPRVHANVPGRQRQRIAFRLHVRRLCARPATLAVDSCHNLSNGIERAAAQIERAPSMLKPLISKSNVPDQELLSLGSIRVILITTLELAGPLTVKATVSDNNEWVRP